MNILITGGAGYVGYSLVRHLELLTAVENITVYDNLYRDNFNFFTGGETQSNSQEASSDTLSKTRFVKGDILDDYTLEKSLEGIDVVIHMAAHVDFPYSYKDNYLYEQINQFGTANLINSMRKFDLKKLIYLSSESVYGFQEESYEETTPLPENGYGKSKLEGEKYCRLLENQLSLSILRIGNIFGFNPMLRYDSVINRFMMDALIYKKIYIYGNGEQSRPFIHINNVTEELVKIIRDDNSKLHLPINPGAPQNTITNLVDKNLTMNQLRDMMIELIPDLEFTYVNANLNMKGFEMLSNKYKPAETFETTFKQAFQKFQNNFKLPGSHDYK
jgi:UDP-glucose 4-epimerase